MQNKERNDLHNSYYFLDYAKGYQMKFNYFSEYVQRIVCEICKLILVKIMHEIQKMLRCCNCIINCR